MIFINKTEWISLKFSVLFLLKFYFAAWKSRHIDISLLFWQCPSIYSWTGLYAFSANQFFGQRGKSSDYNKLKCYFNTKLHISIRLYINDWKKNICLFFLNVEKRWEIDWYSLYILSIALVLRKLRLKVCLYSHIFTFSGRHILFSFYKVIFL